MKTTTLIWNTPFPESNTGCCFLTVVSQVVCQIQIYGSMDDSSQSIRFKIEPVRLLVYYTCPIRKAVYHN